MGCCLTSNLSQQLTAINDYNAAVDDELDLKKGQLYTILQKSESGWWYARNENGEEGWIPSNYLKNELEISTDMEEHEIFVHAKSIRCDEDVIPLLIDSMSKEIQQFIDSLYPIFLSYLNRKDIIKILTILPVCLSQKISQNKKFVFSLYCRDIDEGFNTRTAILNVTQYPGSCDLNNFNVDKMKDYLITTFEEYQYYMHSRNLKSTSNPIDIRVPDGYIKDYVSYDTKISLEQQDDDDDEWSIWSGGIPIEEIRALHEQSDIYNGSSIYFSYKWKLISECKSFDELVNIIEMNEFGADKHSKPSTEQMSYIVNNLRDILIPNILPCQSYLVIDAIKMDSHDTFEGNAEQGGGSGGYMVMNEILILGIYDIHTVIVLHVNYAGFGSSSTFIRYEWNEKDKHDWQ